MSFYGLIVGLATVIWWSVAERIDPKLKKIIPSMLVVALLGARAYHVLDEWGYYRADLGRVMAVWNGGLSIWGALIGGGVGFFFMTRRGEYTGVERKGMLGAMITPLPLAQALGRVANGAVGEFSNLVLGVPWWGMEAILDLLLFGLLLSCPRQMRFVLYVGGYGLIRLVLQPYR